jgi:RNA methyltransferase, TrmH family
LLLVQWFRTMAAHDGGYMELTRARIKSIKELSRKKSREERNHFLVEGARLVQEAAESNFTIVEILYTAEFMKQHGSLLAHLRSRGTKSSQVSSRELDAIADTVTAQGIVGILERRITPWKSLLSGGSTQSVVVALDAIADPGNLGTMIRTCDYFGVGGVLLGKSGVELYNPKVVRATMGSLFHMGIAGDVDLPVAVTHARSLGYRVYATDPHAGTHFDKVTFDPKSLIVFGNEAWGVSDQLKDLADTRVMIRRYGMAESLNVSVSCGVVLSAVHKLFN